jgi:hypothetical protein
MKTMAAILGFIYGQFNLHEDKNNIAPVEITEARFKVS